MFIQCQHCHTTYKIDENKLPETKSVVRCAKCSEPIPLNRDKQDEVLRKTPKKIVRCDSCGTQYSVPLSSINQSNLKARCGNCGNLFSISKEEGGDPQELSSSSREYEEDFDDGDIDLESIDIPEESEIEVDELFDDIESGKSEDGRDQHDEDYSSAQASDEYLESIKLTSEDDDEDETLLDEQDPDIGEISEEQKYKIFLKPKSRKQEEKEEDTDSSWPSIEDEIIDDELDLLDEPDLEDFTDLDNLGEAPKSAGKKKSKVKKEKKEKKKDDPKKKKSVLLWIIWIIVILALLAVGWFYFNLPTEELYSPTQTETFGNQSKIAILEPLSGRFIQNKNLETNMFVLEGKLLNIYGENISVSGIEVEGYLYPKNSESPITATNYAGVYLDDELLKIGSKDNIESILAELAEENKTEQEFGSDDLIDFQVIFFDAPDTQDIEKLGARIKRFNRREL